MIIATSASSHAQEPAAGVVAVLDLTVNTVNHGEIRVILDGDNVWADVAALEAAGLRRFGGMRRRVGDRVYVRLASIDPPLQVALDEAALTLTLTADASLFGQTTLRFDSGRPDGILQRRVPSAFLNYGATWATGSGRALNLEGGVSVGATLLTSSYFLSQSGDPARGLTAAIVDDPSRLVRYQVGDAFVGTGPLGGSLQLGGVSVSRDFSLDPYFIRYPTTGLAGVVTTPSRIDLYVNNQLVRSMQVQPGAYELANLALPTGAADTRVVVRDAFGGQQEFGGSYLRHDQRARQGAAAVSIRVRRRTPAAVRHALELRRPGVHGRPSHRADEQRHARRAGRIGVGSCLRRPDDVRAGRTARRDRVERCRKPIRRRQRAGWRHRLRIRRPSRKRLARMAAGERHLSDADHATHGRRAARAR